MELEHAKLELEQAKRREEEQKKIIEDLKRQKHQMELQQKRLGEAIMNDVSSVASISNIVQNGQQVNLPLITEFITFRNPVCSLGTVVII